MELTEDTEKARRLAQDIGDAEKGIRRRQENLDRMRAELMELQGEWTRRADGIVLKKRGYTAKIVREPTGCRWWVWAPEEMYPFAKDEADDETASASAIDDAIRDHAEKG